MRRTTTALSLVNLLLVPVATGRRRPEAAWRKAVDRAVADSGGTLDGDERFADDLGFLVRCTAEIPGLTPVGWQAAIDDARMRLENRLRIRRLIQEHPEIADERIERPVFVVGLPRTATTLVHKILAVSPDHRGPVTWEMFFTDIDTSPEFEERQLAAMRKRINAVERFMPIWEVIHPIRADQPEESIGLLPHGTYNLVLRPSMPEYRTWLEARDTTADYEYVKEALKVLQFGRPKRRWILKYPAHLADMDVIRKVFPDATFVWTHRDPTTVIGSLCSLMETSWSLYVKRPDRDAIGQYAVDHLVDQVERGRSARVAMPSEALVDVPYHLLNSDPRRYVPELYQQLDAVWTDADAANLDKAIERPLRDRKHEYTLSHYGLDPLAIEDAFADYITLVTGFNS